MIQRRNLHTIKPKPAKEPSSDVLPGLLIWVLSLIGIVWVVSSVEPSKVESVLLAHGYLPITALVAVFFISSVWCLTRNRRRAFLWGLGFTVVAWFQLQHVLNLWTLFYVIFPLLCIEAILTYLRER